MPELSLSRSKENISELGVPCGTIVPFAGVTAPAGYLLCDGSSLIRGDFAELFQAIGTSWGTASASVFNIPDLRGYVPRGRDGGIGRDPNSGTRGDTSVQGGTGITGQATGDNVGSVQGVSTRLPSISSMTSGSQSASHQHINGIKSGSGVGGNGGSWVTGFGVGSPNQLTGSNNISHTHTITGGGDTETRMKNVYVNYIVKI